jgi:hypothetical protein
MYKSHNVSPTPINTYVFWIQNEVKTRTDGGVSHNGTKYTEIKHYNIIVTIPRKVIRCCIKSILYG